MFEQVRRFLEANFSKISDQEWTRVERMIERIEVPKGEDILKIGRYCHHLWFLEQGAASHLRRKAGKIRQLIFL